MKIELTESEALVLHEWLYQHSGKKELFDDPAEQYVFWNMDCQLEKELTDIFAKDYTEKLALAREAVKKNY